MGQPIWRSQSSEAKTTSRALQRAQDSAVLASADEYCLQQLFVESDAFWQALNLKKVAQRRMSKLQGQPVRRRVLCTLPGKVSLRLALEEVVESLQAGLIERDTEVRLLLLAALSGEHILYLGPPGTAKSELGRRLSLLYDGPFFERLLTRFSVPEELFGPLSMRALERDQYCRQTAGYLPEASVAFIDEVFKANSSILNTLLTVMNERLFDNGSSRTKVPLKCLVAASNELPENEELDALYDRFLIRRQVAQVSNHGLRSLLQIPAASSVGSQQLPAKPSAPAADGHCNGNVEGKSERYGGLPISEFADVRRRALQEVSVPSEVISLLTDLRQHMQTQMQPHVYVSDRRLLKAVRMLQVAAYTNGRSEVALQDCLLLQHVFWQRPEELTPIADYISSQLAAADGCNQTEFILTGLYHRAAKLRKLQACTDQPREASPADEKALKDDVAALLQTCSERLADTEAKRHAAYDAIEQQHLNALKDTDAEEIEENMWISKDERLRSVTAMVPKLEASLTAATSLLQRAGILQVFLEDPCTTSEHLEFLLQPSCCGQIEVVSTT